MLAGKDTDTIVSVEGLNGIGDRNSGIWCRQTSLVFKPGETAVLNFGAPSQVRSIAIEPHYEVGGAPACTIEAMTSNSMQVGRGDDRFTVQAPAEPLLDRLFEVEVGFPSPETFGVAAIVLSASTATGNRLKIARLLLMREPTEV